MFNSPFWTAIAISVATVGFVMLMSPSRAQAAGCKNCSAVCVPHCRNVWCPTRFTGKRPIYGHWQRICSCYKPR